MSAPIRILIADDHLIVREGLHMILESRAEFEIVGEAADGEAAVQLTETTQPDVVLMDLRMPGMDGLRAIQQIRARWPEVAVVILTTYNEDDLMLRGLRAGARSYLLKDTDRETLFSTIQAAARGETLLRPDILARVLAPVENVPRAGVTLSQRELEILRSVARGSRNKEIAAQLGLAERTVKAHLDSIFNKLGVDSRTSAVALAIQYGILPTDAGSASTEADNS
jgi:NarL family two-component system response regulator YdfI